MKKFKYVYIFNNLIEFNFIPFIIRKERFWSI